MAVTQNTYTGDGTTVLFSFTFPYLETTDIKVSLNGTVTTAYTLANATTIQFNTAPANGAAIRIYRQTDDSALAATFYPGSAIRSNDLNENFTQNLYVTQESSNNAATATSTANTALTNSATAINTANASTATANTALSNSQTALTQSSSAVSTANSASSSASSAVSTANSAAANAATALTNSQTALTQSANAVTTANQSSSTAGTALTNSQTALTQSSSAVSTATTAASNASTALSNSQTALTQSASATSSANTAISTANAAASAVANAILYDTVANVAAIPASPANNDAVEVVNSTGIESFSPLSGRPAGFVGDSGLSVRMVYTTAGATWNWIQYFPNDPETRYGDAITTLQTDLNTAEADILALDSAKLDATTAASTYLTQSNAASTYLTQANAASTYQTQAGMSSYLTTTAAGTTYAPLASPTFTGTATAPSVTVTGSTAPTNGVYLPGVNSFGIATNSTERFRIDSSGRVGIGTSSPSKIVNARSSSQYDGFLLSNASNSVVEIVGFSATNDNGAVLLRNGGAANVQLLASGASYFNGGNVGIGTTSPSARLTVAGNAVGVVSALTDGATITPDFSLANNFSVTLGGNRTLANPSNLTAGQAGTIVITQDGTGSRTLAFGSNWKFPGGTAPTLTTTASAVDIIAYYVESATRITARLIADVK